MTLLTDEIRAFIGQEATYEAPEALGAASFRYFALAIGDENPVYQKGNRAPDLRLRD